MSPVDVAAPPDPGVDAPVDQSGDTTGPEVAAVGAAPAGDVGLVPPVAAGVDGTDGETAPASLHSRLRSAVSGRHARLLLPVLAVVAVGAAGLLQSPAPETSDEGDHEAPAAPVEVVTEVAEGPVVPVGEVTANLAGPEVHHARVAIAVVLGADVEPEEVGDRLPVLTDAVVEELARRSYDELSAAGGGDALRDALTERAHQHFGEDTVVRVLLTGLLVQ